MTGLLHIFPLSSTYLQGNEKENQTNITAALQKLDEATQPLLLYGDELCGKTVLLFQAAVSYASQGHHVTFISRRPLSRMPLSVHGMTRPDTAGLLKTLTFLYMSSAEELVKYCSCVHMKTLLPDVLVVDDLQYYLSQLVDPSPEAGAARLCALIVDSAEYIKVKSDQKKCLLLMGCQSYRKANMTSVLKQFNISIANIAAVNLQDRSYTMSVPTQELNAELSYTIKSSGLFLETVSFIT